MITTTIPHWFIPFLMMTIPETGLGLERYWRNITTAPNSVCVCRLFTTFLFHHFWGSGGGEASTSTCSIPGQGAAHSTPLTFLSFLDTPAVFLQMENILPAFRLPFPQRIQDSVGRLVVVVGSAFFLCCLPCIFPALYISLVSYLPTPRFTGQGPFPSQVLVPCLTP